MGEKKDLAAERFSKKKKTKKKSASLKKKISLIFILKKGVVEPHTQDTPQSDLHIVKKWHSPNRFFSSLSSRCYSAQHTVDISTIDGYATKQLLVELMVPLLTSSSVSSSTPPQMISLSI